MASKSNTKSTKTIQLFALQVPTQISLPFDLYALSVPDEWKELFNRLQQIKLGKNYVLPPVECLNQVLQLLVDGILFSSPNAFRLKSSAKWLYFKSDNIDTDYIATVVKNWLRVSFENCSFLTTDDIDEINRLSGSDLKFEEVQLTQPVWDIKDGKINLDNLYYDLIPYLLASAVAKSPLALINLKTNEEFEKVNFREIVSAESGAKEVISWPPMPAIKTIKKEGSEEKEKTTHYYSYCLTFALHYTTGGEPYIICDYGIKRWVSWEFKYLHSGATVCIKPTKSTRFAACKLKYMGKEKGIDFESNLARLVKELNFQDKFTAKDVIQTPCKKDELAWAVTYSNTMSPSHNTDVGFFPIDHEIFLQACMERFKDIFGDNFPLVEIYSHCANNKAFKKSVSHYKKVTEFIKSHFAEQTNAPPFYIPPNLKLVLLAQSKEAEDLIPLLARKYKINNVIVQELGSLGAELPCKKWDIDCKNRIEEFEKNEELRKNLSTDNQAVTLTLVEILPKDNFWKNPEKDPKPCFRPALARMGSVTDHFVPKDENDDEDSLEIEDLNDKIAQKEAAKEAAKNEGKSYKSKPLKSEFAIRLENTLLSGLSMAGAYFYPIFEVDKFPSDVASVGVYLIPYYKPNTLEVPIYRVCDEEGELAGHTAGVFYPSSQNAECGYYYLSNQRPESRSGGILQESKLIPMAKTRGEKKGELKKPKPYAQGYNPRGVFLNLSLQEKDCFSDWASFVQCLRLYGLIHYLGATTWPAPLHLAAGLNDYRPIHAIREH